MSVQLCSPAVINALVSFGAKAGLTYSFMGKDRPIAGNQARVAAILYAENVRSHNKRYPDNPADPMGFRFMEYVRVVPMMQITVGANYYSYQSCECDDWRESEAYAIIRVITRRSITANPEYRACDWGMPDDLADNAQSVPAGMQVSLAGLANRAIAARATVAPASAPAAVSKPAPAAVSKPAPMVVSPKSKGLGGMKVSTKARKQSAF